MNSIMTNDSAMIAVEALDNTKSQLEAVQKQISTGYRVADATDDGAAYAVAEIVRSDVGALTAANQNLGGAKGLLSTTMAAMKQIITKMQDAQQQLVSLADPTITTPEKTNYQSQYTSDVQQIKNFISDSSYNGKTLIGSFAAMSGYGDFSVVRNDTGSTYSVASFDGSTFYNALTMSTVLGESATSIGAALTTTGAFTTQLNSINAALANYGTATDYVNSQVSFNSDKIDAMNSGIGALVDANMTQESAMLQALQVRQQLATQALSIANQSPTTLLKLFGG